MGALTQYDPEFWAQIHEWERLGIIKRRGYNLASPYDRVACPLTLDDAVAVRPKAAT